MSTQDNGGPAFPHPGGSRDASVQESYLGMTLRDYFAAKALPIVVAGNFELGQNHLRYDRFEVTALDAYKMADAMLKARAQ